MNSTDFGCRTCKNHHDAGDKWCRRHLEQPGIIERGKQVDIEAVLNAETFWKVPDLDVQGLDWLRNHLLSIRRFLENHRAHDVLYDESQSFLWGEDEFDWMDEAKLDEAEGSPRLYIERLGFTTWQQVEEYVSKGTPMDEPSWWTPQDTPEFDAARQKFDALIRERR